MKKGIIKKALKRISIATLPVVLSLTIVSSVMQQTKFIDSETDYVPNGQIESTESVGNINNPEIESEQLDLETETNNEQVSNENIATDETESKELESAETETETAGKEPDEIVESDYASMEQIYALMEGLNADNTYFRTYQNFADITKPDVFNILNHNDGEPIYIVIPEDYNEMSRQMVTKSLDVVFGIISQVNDKYTYEIVDKVPQGKCSIEYRIAEAHSNGLAWYDFDYQSIRSRRGVITIDNTIINNAEQQNNLLYTLTHELLHVLGFNDIYNTEGSKFEGQKYAKSFMKSTYFLTTTENFVPITPNDYKLLLSAYASPCNNQDEYQATFDKIDALVKGYEKEYYEHNVKFVENRMGEYQVAQFSNKFVIGFEDFLGTNKKMAIKVDGDRYQLFVADESGAKNKVCEGNIFISGSGIILQNLNVPNAYINNTGGEQFIGDIAIGCGINDGEIKIFVCDYSSTIFFNAVAVSGFEHLQENALGY